MGIESLIGSVAGPVIKAVAGPVIGGLFGSRATSKAVDAQTNSADQSLALQKQMFDEQNRLNAPFREAGLAGQNRLMDLLGLSQNTGAAGYGSAAQNFGMSNFNADPGYQFRLDQGQKAIERSAAARGGVLSGAAVKAAADYNQGSASQEYNNAYNRFQSDRSGILNPLQSLSGQGQSATNQLSANAGNYGQNASNLITQSGNARASGYVGSANAITGGIGQGINAYQNQNLINNLFPNANQSGYGMTGGSNGATSLGSYGLSGGR
jgi:hypothetical protein